MGEVIHLLKPISLDPRGVAQLKSRIAAKAEIRWHDDADGVPFIRVTLKEGERVILERDVEMGNNVTVDLIMQVRK